MKFLTNLDLNQNQALNMVIQKLAIAPTSPVEGQVYFDTGKKRLYCYSGTKWEGSDALDAVLTGADIITAINSSSSTINDARLSSAVRDAVSKAHSTHAISDVTGLSTALSEKANSSQVLTNVPTGALFTDTITTVNNKTGVITKADIVALGIPAQDTVYEHPIGDNPHNITKTKVGLGNADNTSDLAKPVSNATQTALNSKVDNSRVLTNVPENALFTDTKYTHPTTAGNKHIPTAGIVGQILKNTASGTGDWVNETLTTINGKTGAITKADIVALGIPSVDTDTTYTVFNTTKDGLVPKPLVADSVSFLRGDGTWVTPNDTKYTLPIATPIVLGGVKSGTDITVDASGNVSVNDNSHAHTTANITGLDTTLGNLATKTVAQGYATTALGDAKTYTDGAISNLVGSAPEVLDTLHEIAVALGDDPNFATTITTEIGKKADKFVQVIGGSTSIVVTHNFNSRDLAVTLRESASPYAQVITDIEFTTVNTCTVKFAVAPTAGQYTITIIG